MKDVFESIIERAKKVENKTIVFPEGEEKRIVAAVKKFVEETQANAIVLGREENLIKLYGNNDKIQFVDPNKASELKDRLTKKLYELRKHKGLTEEQAYSIISEPNYFACVMVVENLADGIVSGAITKSADVMRPAFQVIKQKPDMELASSCFIMEVPENKWSQLGENGLMVLADCAVVQYPTATELSSIASASIETAKTICGINPRVSFLSYTSGAVNPKDEEVKKIQEATELTKAKHPELIIEGDLQADASLNQETAKTKVPNSLIAGRANTLIFPNIFAGNIGYKLIQQFAGVRAVGPILQGLNKPINDLSRGANEEEIYLTALITLIQCEG